MFLPPAEILAFIAMQAVEAGIAVCGECEEPLTPDDDYAVVCCPDCGKISIVHTDCVTDELRQQSQQNEARANWRLN